LFSEKGTANLNFLTLLHLTLTCNYVPIFTPPEKMIKEKVLKPSRRCVFPLFFLFWEDLKGWVEFL